MRAKSREKTGKVHWWASRIERVRELLYQRHIQTV
jgi:hypothetical protein